MLGRLKMDIEECISSYIELIKTVFGRKSSPYPVIWRGNTKGRFDSLKLKVAVEKVIAQYGSSKQELLDNGHARGCRV